MHFRVSTDLTIKIHDFGLAKDQYLKDYYKEREGRSPDDVDVPVRWLARESLREGHFSTKSDAVRYLFPIQYVLQLLSATSILVAVESLFVLRYTHQAYIKDVGRF